ncbi:PA4780 family RIO1-like protein kinase [Methylicorpusculum sp.]|uniref:PA4780 family RIO1-like protein kinase n=1 Tax=Methylicorpusculum sp. TaxID=2713644 RepID=UPI002ABC8E93|nr:PA4780 family RIO1-like protein kinase [Methylicorpusculum sp.]MDZ4153081.1 PA4780 family RIO1-like protein kinase [Methylicorpusculum sp.]
MKTPKRLEPLIDNGLIDEVIHSLKSGKEAAVYVVRCGTVICCAKVYKEADQRSFRQSVLYQEGRKVRNSRRARAMAKGSSYGRKEQESTWQSAEVTALYRLSEAGVRVPRPYDFIDGVLLMELLTDSDGNPAPRLNDLDLEPELARTYHRFLISQIVRMLCDGLIHGDLSEYNVLVGSDGPVIIDLPQAVDAAGNNNARMMLERDVANMTNYFGRFAPELLTTAYGKEMWKFYQSGELRLETQLTGYFEEDTKAPDVGGVMREIDAARKENEEKQLYKDSVRQ